MGLTKEANINWVNDLQVIQEFEKHRDFWMLTKDKIVVDFALTAKSKGFLGTRSVQYRNHDFNPPKQPSVFDGTSKVITLADADSRGEEFWTNARQEPLSIKEKRIYKMVDTLQTVPAFKNTLNIISTLTSGYWQFEKVGLGPVGAFYSFNDIEGFRLRIGGGTTVKFNPKLQLEGYVAYGFKDERLKHGGGILYSFNDNY
ncbi:MAG: DUF5686 family protein [Bacteroidota bacterium]